MPLENILNDIQGVIWGSRGINVQFKGTALSKAKGETDQFVDLWTSEHHSLKVNKSNYPVQSGFVISDTAYVEPKKLSLQGYIVNVQSVPYTLGVLGYSNKQRIKNGWSLLEKAAKELMPLNVNTNVASYTNMLITGLSTSMDKSTGTNMLFNIDFEEIKIVQSQLVSLSADKLSGDNNPAKNMTDKANAGQVQGQTSSLASNFFSNLKIGI